MVSVNEDSGANTGSVLTGTTSADGPVTVTYGYRDVPFNDSNGVAKNIMAGICDRCGQVIVIPAQSEPAISQARKRVEHSLEVNIPAAYIDILDAAVMRIATHPTMTNPQTVVSPGLTFTGYAPSGIGNAVGIANTGQDRYKDFAYTLNSGDV